MTRVVLVAGLDPANVCGVGDYTRSLAAALMREGVEVDLLLHGPWNVGGTFQVVRRLLAADQSVVHIQYPTEGYGYSLAPQFCSLVRRSVATLHEFSIAHPVRKLSLVPFTLRSPYVVMTSEYEKVALIRKMPWVATRVRVIPIGTNIPPARAVSRECHDRIAYFGLIMPRKGLEDFVEVCRLARAKGYGWEMLIMGRILARHAAYTKNLMDSAHSVGVRWVLDPSPEEVSALLLGTRLGYFPFPDGASERRGSLKAALSAGVPCITTRTEHTSRELAQAVAFAATPLEAFELASRLMRDTDERECLSRAALEYSKTYSWKKIAEAHVQIYEELAALMRKE